MVFVSSVPENHWLEALSNRPISDSFTFKVGIAQSYRFGKVGVGLAHECDYNMALFRHTVEVLIWHQ
jgi:hypothetical protein